jgi:L-alanine-DL-glutamate epimerase-like enolase superfamily enzyme
VGYLFQPLQKRGSREFMSRIISVETRIVDTPILTEIKTTYGSWSRQSHVIVKITTEDGTYGLGESSPLEFFTGESPDMVKMVIDQILTMVLIGKDPFDIEALLLAMDHRLPKNASSKSAMDGALHDLVGKLLGIPVYRLLGGRCRQGLITAATVVGIDTPDKMRKEARGWVEKGFRTLKLKIGIDPKTDEQSIEAVRDAVGKDIRIRVDANQGYSANTAIQVAKNIEKYTPEYIEQPVPAWDIEGMAHVRRSVNIPIAADESLYSPYDAMRLIRAEAVDVFGIKFIKTGGLARAKKIANLAEASGIECVVISPIETALGTAAGAHWALSVPNANADHELVGPLFIQDSYFEGIEIIGHSIEVSDRPGVGISLKKNLF